MQKRLQDVFKFEPEALNRLVIERVQLLHDLRLQTNDVERELQFLRQALRIIGENVFPENVESPSPGVEIEVVEPPTIEERALEVLKSSPTGTMPLRSILIEIQKSPHPITGTNAYGTLNTTLRRSPRFARVPEDPNLWRVVPLHATGTAATMPNATIDTGPPVPAPTLSSAAQLIRGLIAMQSQLEAKKG